jgi:hypothetical protein
MTSILAIIYKFQQNPLTKLDFEAFNVFCPEARYFSEVWRICPPTSPTSPYFMG